MKTILKITLVVCLTSLPLFAHAEPMVQYIDCSDADPAYWDKTIVALDSEAGFGLGTLFISSDVEDPSANTGVLRLEEDLSAPRGASRVYRSRNRQGEFKVTLPASILGVRSDRFEAALELRHGERGSSYDRDLICFTRMYPRPDTWRIPNRD